MSDPHSFKYGTPLAAWLCFATSIVAAHAIAAACYVQKATTVAGVSQGVVSVSCPDRVGLSETSVTLTVQATTYLPATGAPVKIKVLQDRRWIDDSQVPVPVVLDNAHLRQTLSLPVIDRPQISPATVQFQVATEAADVLLEKPVLLKTIVAAQPRSKPKPVVPPRVNPPSPAPANQAVARSSSSPRKDPPRVPPMAPLGPVPAGPGPVRPGPMAPPAVPEAVSPFPPEVNGETLLIVVDTNLLSPSSSAWLPTALNEIVGTHRLRLRGQGVFVLQRGRPPQLWDGKSSFGGALAFDPLTVPESFQQLRDALGKDHASRGRVIVAWASGFAPPADLNVPYPLPPQREFQFLWMNVRNKENQGLFEKWQAQPGFLLSFLEAPEEILQNKLTDLIP